MIKNEKYVALILIVSCKPDMFTTTSYFVYGLGVCVCIRMQFTNETKAREVCRLKEIHKNRKGFYPGLLITFLVHFRMFPSESCWAERVGQSPPTRRCHTASSTPLEVDHYKLFILTNLPFWLFPTFPLQSWHNHVCKRPLNIVGVARTSSFTVS